MGRVLSSPVSCFATCVTAPAEAVLLLLAITAALPRSPSASSCTAA
jgi:hypothetical protein